MQIIPYILLILSILFETSKNVFSNNFSKNVLKNETDIYKFNFYMYIGSVFVLFLIKSSESSVYTIVMAVFFALAIWLNQHYFLKALEYGSMSFTSFVIGTSLVVPIIFGILVWNEKITILQIALLAVLLFAMALALNLGKEKLNIKWLCFSFLSMLFMGVIGIIQAAHQKSAHSDELISFLRYAFIFTVIINFIGWKITERKQKASFEIKSAAIVQAAFSGAFMGAVHIINLYLAGVLPKVLFFPIINGGLIFVTLISDLIFFKERLNIKQWIGIIIGTLALCTIGL